MAQYLIEKENDSMRFERQNLINAEKQLKEAETVAVERANKDQEVQELRQRNERTQAWIDARQEEQGTNLESESEMRRLKQLKKNYQTEFEKKAKQVAALEKQTTKNKEKA